MDGLKIDYVHISEITPYKNNARKHQKADLQAIKSSIEEFGFLDALGVWGDKNIIIEGHGRYQAAKELGYNELPVVHLDWLTDEQRRAYALAHNKTAELSEWDPMLLDLELGNISDIDMASMGFENKTVQDTSNEEVVEDDFDEQQVETIAKHGEVYELGNHRLMCGDSTNPDDVEILMNGKLADLFLTDPPYNVSIGTRTQFIRKMTGKSNSHKDIEGDGDGKSDEQVGEGLWLPAFTNAIYNAKDDCAVYITMPQGGTHMMMMMMMMRQAGWNVKHELIWVKNQAVFSMGRLDYDYRHEPILYGWNKKHNFYVEDYKTSVLDDTSEIDKLSKDELKELLHKIVDNSSVIYEDKPKKCDLHPTMKPVALFGKLIKNSTKKGDIVLDLFGGSGTTMIACEQLGRKCYMMEHDPKYVDVIISRLEQLTGRKAKKVN